MPKIDSYLDFNYNLDEMLKTLILWFPDEKHFVDARTQLELAMKWKIREPMSQFLTAVFPYRFEILNRNLEFFTNSAKSSNCEALKMFNFGKKVNTLTLKQQDDLWMQLHDLLSLAETTNTSQLQTLIMSQ